MNRCKHIKCLSAVLLSAAIIMPSAAQDKAGAKAGAGQPSEADMMTMMMDLAKPGENHKMLAEGVGSWNYAVKFWMNPGGPALESKGQTVIKEILGGRYFVSDHTGKMQMPGADGKLTDMDFKGMSVEGYDNVKKKFVATWVDNMGTSIMMLEGTYDAATKTITYTAEYEPMPGMRTKVRELIKLTDKNHRTFEWYEDRGGTEVKTMEINYTRKS